MKAFTSVADIQTERNSQRGNSVIYTLLGVLIGEIDRLPTRDNPTPDQIYKEVNKLYNNAVEMSQYKPEAELEANYLKDYIKQQLTYEQLEEIIFNYQSDGAKSMGDFMKRLNIEYKGQFDGKMANEIVLNKILGNTINIKR